MVRYTYETEAILYRVPQQDLLSGDLTYIPVVVRRMYILSPDPNRWLPRKIKINRYVRGEDVRYSVHELQERPVDLWPLPKYCPDPPLKYKKVATLNEDEFYVYVQRYLRCNAATAIHELLTRKVVRSWIK